MVKEIERAGIPVVQIANLVPVAKSTGANKIVPSFSIPYPLGDPSKSEEEQWQMRYHRVGVALDALTDDAKEQTVYKVRI